MTRFTAVLVCLVTHTITTQLYAIDPDPAKLLPTPTQSEKAKHWTQKLGDPIYSIRDEATKELRKLGLASLPILKATLDTTADPEVRNRCELLLPAIELASLKMRVETFLADSDNKYDHKLPGWEDFRAITGDDATAKKLFASLFDTTVNRELLILRTGSKEQYWKQIAARRAQLANVRSLALAARVIAINGRIVEESSATGPKPTLADVVSLLFAESNTKQIGNLANTDRTYYYTLSNLLRDPETLRHLQAQDGAAFRKLVAHWMETRDNPIELYTMVSLAQSLNIAEAPVARYAEKVLSTAGVSPSYKLNTLTQLGRANDKAHLPIFAKALKDTTEMKSTLIRNNVREEKTIQVRDIALIMSILTTKQNVADYGIEFTPPNTSGSDAIMNIYKYSYMYYRIKDDATRTAAFKKWDEWQAAQKKGDEKK